VGYYLETPKNIGKADTIKKLYGAISISQEDAKMAARHRAGAVICVVRNPSFDVAAFCYDEAEFERFTNKHDPRPKTWLCIEDRELVARLTNYKEPKTLREFELERKTKCQ
jgi:hypothetical protein